MAGFDDNEALLTASGYKRPAVQWYPGHIAKAERQLSETLKAVDVVIEVRDARAPRATAHPRVGEWSGGKPRVVVLTKADLVPATSRSEWRMSYQTLGAARWDAEADAQTKHRALQARSERGKYDTRASPRKKHISPKSESPVEDVLFVDAKKGLGIRNIHRAIIRSGSHVNERRRRRGLCERPLRVGVIGYPNVGKSALINKILGRKRARTANTPGVTRSLQWIRVRTDDFKESRGKEFELLDSPGIIPAQMVDQSDALLLAACNSIGSAAYDNQAVAAYLCEWLKTLHAMGKGDVTSPQWRHKCNERYGFDPLVPPALTDPTSHYPKDRLMSGEDILFRVADNTCQGDPENAARKILQDFRTGRMGLIALQLAPESGADDGHRAVQITGTLRRTALEYDEAQEAERETTERARVAMEMAKERGLELPPLVADLGDTGEEHDAEDEEKSSPRKEPEIGKGLFDGW